jgi:hypothetical protein
MPLGRRNMFGKIIKDIFKIKETIKQRLFFYLQSQLKQILKGGIIILDARNYSLDLDFKFGV